MFKVEPNPTFWAPVQLTIVGEDAPVEISMQFRHKARADLEAWIKDIGTRIDADIVGDIVLDWKEVDVPFSTEALRVLVDNHHRSGDEIFRGYIKALTESRVKN